ncbi:carbonate dehydratase [Sulfurivermis fontis]|uniref:carbonate dehydratase n=1 Tax=Sulfurivermis fontis TaxID=1972068 RepID=UPI000FDA90B4|nr:carbonate dehydratase [Sulfurivermis fontis]
MADELADLFQNNRTWAAQHLAQDPAFFTRLSQQQSPEYLWIGCSDSRVPANDIVGLAPGELFVHRNVGNLVYHTDFNCMSVLQYAIEILQVKHIIVTGHYGCGGVRAALQNRELGLIDNWLHNVRDIYDRNRTRLERLDEEARIDRLCELNVVQQVANVCHTTIVQRAWHKGQALSVHGCIYSINDGILRDLGVQVSGADQLAPVYRIEE